MLHWNEGVNWERGMESASHSPSMGWQRKGIIRRMEKKWQGNQLYGTQRGKSIQNRVGEEQSDPRSKNKNGGLFDTAECERSHSISCTEGFIRNLKNTKQFLKQLSTRKENHWKRLWCWEKLKIVGEGDDRGYDGWKASLTQWTWVGVSSRSWGWTGKPGVLQSMGSQKVGHDWLRDWTELKYKKKKHCTS